LYSIVPVALNGEVGQKVVDGYCRVTWGVWSTAGRHRLWFAITKSVWIVAGAES
jgi:hypothetical protein